MKPSIDYTIYLITDRNAMSTKTVEESVEQAINGGCTLVQLREKNISSRDFYNTAKRVREITDKYQVPLIINDRVDIALAVDADGVHVGQKDIPAKSVREIIGKDKIVGVSASCLSEALIAAKDGADYLGVGAMFRTDTKKDADILTMEELYNIRKFVDIPIVVIGGIDKTTIPRFFGMGIDGLAIISAIVSQKDITKSAKEIKDMFVNQHHK